MLLLLVWGMFTSLGLYLTKTDTVLLSQASVCLQWRSHLESKEHGYEATDGRDCVLRSAQLRSRLTQSLGHRSRTGRACISRPEINWFPFPFPPSQKENANKWLPRSASARGKEEGKGFIFLPLSVARDTWLEENNDKYGKRVYH